jgi:hypothetical protein
MKYAHLMFDREKRLVGIKFSKQSDADAYPIQVTKTRSHGSIAGTSFLKTYDIFPVETKTYAASYNEQAKMLIVDVANEGAQGARRKVPAK